MKKYHVDLTADEATLLSKIDLQVRHPSHTEAHAAHNANKLPILALLRSLSERQAIPQERRSYWIVPEYNPGRVQASRKEAFERNGTRGEDIYVHPHFVPHLRYFLFGAELLDEVIAAFEAGVGDPAWVTSSDIVPIGRLARDLAQRHGLEKTSAADEFFKLSLDIGLGLSTALSVFRAVRQMRKP